MTFCGVAILFLTGCGNVIATDGEVSLVPRPVSVTKTVGKFVLTPSTRIVMVESGMANLYANREMTLAKSLRHADLVNNALLDLADRYILSGMYVEAESLIRQIDPEKLPLLLYPRYYHVCHAYYEGMMGNSVDPRLCEEQQADKALEKLLEHDGNENMAIHKREILSYLTAVVYRQTGDD